MDNFWKIIVLVALVLGMGLVGSLVSGHGGYFGGSVALLVLAGMGYGAYKSSE